MLQTHWSDYYHGDYPRTLTGAVVVKAGEGLSYTDSSYPKWIADATRGGHHCYAYYALHTARHGSAEMVIQARRAARLIGRRPAMFDVERWPAESGSPAGIAEIGEVLTAIDTYRAEGVMHVCYLPRSQWETMGRPSLLGLASRRIHVINADYRAGSERYGSAAWDGYGGIKPWAVQYAPCHNTAPGSWADAQAVWDHGGSTGTPVSSPRPPADNRYTVRAGDTMASIAAAHHLTLAELEHLNPTAGHPAGHFDLIRPDDLLDVTK